METELSVVKNHIFTLLDILIQACKRKNEEYIFLSLDFIKRILDFFIKESLKQVNEEEITEEIEKEEPSEE